MTDRDLINQLAAHRKTLGLKQSQEPPTNE